MLRNRKVKIQELYNDQRKHVLEYFMVFYLELIINQLLNSAFVCSKDLCRFQRVLSTLAYNTLLDLNNSTDHTQLCSIIIVTRHQSSTKLFRTSLTQLMTLAIPQLSHRCVEFFVTEKFSIYKSFKRFSARWQQS